MFENRISLLLITFLVYQFYRNIIIYMKILFSRKYTFVIFIKIIIKLFMLSLKETVFGSRNSSPLILFVHLQFET